MVHRRSRVAALAVPMTLLVAASACSADEPGCPQESSAASRPADAAASAAPVPDPLCEPGDGRQVERLPDVVVPPVQVPAVEDPETGEDCAPGSCYPR